MAIIAPEDGGSALPAAQHTPIVPSKARARTVDEILGPRTVDEILGPEPDKEAAPELKDKGEKAPAAFLDRLSLSENPAVKVVLKAAEGAAAGFGSGPLGISDTTADELRKIGLFSDPASGRGGLLRDANETVIRPIAALGDAALRAITGGIHGGAAAIGEITRQATGDETDAKRAEREALNLANFLMLQAPSAVPLMRVQRTALGAIEEVPIGRLPKPQDFENAATVVGGDSKSKALVRQTYEERGITPAEVAHDASKDVTIAQDILTGEVPQAYGGGKGGNKPPPVDPANPGSLASEVPRLEPPTVEGKVVEPAKPIADTELAQAKKDVLDRVIKGHDEGRKLPTLEEVYTRYVDELNPVNLAQKDALKTLNKKEPLAPGSDPYELFRLTRGVAGKADEWLVNAPFSFKDYAPEGKSFKQILAPVVEDIDGFRAYIVSKRVLELEGRGIKTGFDIEQAQKVVTGGGNQYAPIQRELVDYQNKLTAYLRDAGVLSDKAYEAMMQANKEYVPMHRYFGEDLGKNSGQAGAGLKSRNPIKVIKGSDLAVLDPIETIIKNTYTYLALAEKNAAGLKLVDLMKEADASGPQVSRRLIPFDQELKSAEPGALQLGWTKAETSKTLVGEVQPPTKMVAVREPNKNFIDASVTEALAQHGIKSDELAAVITTNIREPGVDTITVFREGKRETYKVSDPDLISAWRGLNRNTATLAQRFWAIPARTLRVGAVLDPAFIAKNIIRDFFQAVVNSKGALFSPVDTIQGFKAVVTKNETFHEWMRAGGANSNMVTLDRRYIQENLIKLNAQTGLWDRAWNIVNSPLTGLRMTAELMENTTRLGEFIKQTKGTARTKGELQSAAFASREVTLDFARMGAQMHGWNMITAFSNAQIQGTDRLVRAFKTDPLGTSLKIGAGITIPSMLLWWANHEDPRWKQIPNWQKDMYWIVMTKDNIFRIPKPFTTGVVFGSGIERSLEAYFGDNPDALKGFSQSVASTVALGMVPSAASPVVEQFANRDLFVGNQLVPSRHEHTLPEYRYTPFTTQTARALGSLLGAFPGMREAALDDKSAFNGVANALSTPILLENYLKRWTGGLGVYALQITDASLRKAGVVPDPPKPLSTLADIPFVKAFVVRYPDASPQPLQDFYERNTRALKIITTFKTLAKEGDVQAAQRVNEIYGMEAPLTQLQTALSQHSQLIRNVYADPKMSPEDKRQLIDTTYMAMARMGDAGNEILKAFSKKVNKRLADQVLGPEPK